VKSDQAVTYDKAYVRAKDTGLRPESTKMSVCRFSAYDDMYLSIELSVTNTCTLYNIECCCVGHEMRARLVFSCMVHERPYVSWDEE